MQVTHNILSRPPASKSTRAKVTKDKIAITRKETDSPPSTTEDVSVAKQSTPRKSTSKSGAAPRQANLREIADAQALFFVWDLDADGFVSAHDEALDAKIIERTSGDYNYWIAATCDEGDLIMHKIASDINPRWCQQSHSLTWNYNLGGTYGSWAFQFTSPEEYETFKVAFTKALWETLHQVPWAKIKVE